MSQVEKPKTAMNDLLQKSMEQDFEMGIVIGRKKSGELTISFSPMPMEHLTFMAKHFEIMVQAVLQRSDAKYQSQVKPQ